MGHPYYMLSSEDLGVMSGDRSERQFETGCKGMMQNIGFGHGGAVAHMYYQRPGLNEQNQHEIK